MVDGEVRDYRVVGSYCKGSYKSVNGPTTSILFIAWLFHSTGAPSRPPAYRDGLGHKGLRFRVY